MTFSTLPTHVALRLAEHEHALRTEARHQAVHVAEHRARRARRRGRWARP